MSVRSIIRPIVLCGPSGSGKSTLISKLQSEAQFANKFGFSVSHTTRSPRPGEADGVAYHFTTRDKMKDMIAANQFIEHAEFSGNMYGTSRAAVNTVTEAGKVCLLDIDTQGVRQLKALDAKATGLNCYYIFIDIPSMELLESRLRGRGTETEEKIQLRLAQATAECEYGRTPGVFDAIVVNHELETAYSNFRSYILKSNPHLAVDLAAGDSISGAMAL